jgi:N-acetylmuramoyl-L-alanine amidase
MKKKNTIRIFFDKICIDAGAGGKGGGLVGGGGLESALIYIYIIYRMRVFL